MRRVTAAEKINRALANYLALPLPSHQRDSPTLAANVLPARSTNCSAGFTEEHVLQPRVQSIRVLQKLPQGKGGFALSREQQLANRRTDCRLDRDNKQLIRGTVITDDQCMQSFFEGVLFLTSDTQTDTAIYL